MNSLNGLSYTSTNLSGLATGNFDEIVSNNITAIATYQKQIPIQNIIFLGGLSANVQEQINSINSNGNSGAITDLKTILTGASWDAAYNFLNLTNNLHVYGVLFLGDPQIDVGYIISTLPSMYATILDLQTNYVTYDAQTSEFITRLANYVTNQSLTTTLSSYVTDTSLTSSLSNYATNTNLSSVSAKITAISYATGSPNVTSISDKLQCSVLSFSTTLNGVSPTTFGYISTLSRNVENSLSSNASDVQVLKDATRNLTSAHLQVNQQLSTAPFSLLEHQSTVSASTISVTQ